MEKSGTDGNHLLHPAFPLSSAAWLRHHAGDPAALRRKGTAGCRNPVRCPECPVRKGWISPLPMESGSRKKRIPIDLRRAEGAQTGAGPAGGACCQWPRHFTGGTGMSETKTLHRNFWVWEFEKEERWLNEMAQEAGPCRMPDSAPTPLKRRNPASTSSGLPCWTVPRILKVSWESWKHRALGIASVGDISAAAPS